MSGHGHHGLVVAGDQAAPIRSFDRTCARSSRPSTLATRPLTELVEDRAAQRVGHTICGPSGD